MIKPWATYTWYLFHTIGQRINPVYFKNNTSLCLNIIYAICDILPCPVCKKHAIAYLNNNNFYQIQTKAQLNMFFFTFHNTVNARLGKKQASLADLEKYNLINRNLLYNRFRQYITAKYYNIVFFSQGRRIRVINKISPHLLDIFNNM
jgi:hypothetical protein